MKSLIAEAFQSSNPDSSENVLSEGTQKNNAGDDVNPETGLPEINWDAHKKYQA